VDDVFALGLRLTLVKLRELAIGLAVAKRSLEDVDEPGAILMAVHWSIATGFKGDYSTPKVTALEFRDLRGEFERSDRFGCYSLGFSRGLLLGID
jgi:hypothetical protein